MNDTEIMLIDDEFYIIIFRHISFYILTFLFPPPLLKPEPN